MLLTVEGGGFFSSSASGYTNGLALLIFGRKNDEQPIKVSPWSHYQLVEQQCGPESQPTSRRTQNSSGCSSFNCFKCSQTKLDEQSPSKVGLVDQSETSSDSLSCDTSRITVSHAANASERKPCIKTNIMKPSRDSMMCEGNSPCEFPDQVENETSCCTTARRKVRWTDKCGKELVEIREFELSDYGPSDEEFEQEKFRRCECVIQ